MTGTSEHRTGWTDLDAARLLLEKLGVKPADLTAVPARTEVPLIADYIPLVEQAVTTGTRRVYSPYWAKVVREWGHRRVNEPTALEISQLAEQVRAGAVQRRNARGGRGAAEHLIGALRCMYGYLAADGILTQAENPAARAQKPRRLRSARMALPDSRLDELCRVASTTGNDPALDALLLRLHIRLREKGETVRWQPVSPTLMRHLLAHGETRGGLGSGQRLLRYANGRPITKKRYDYLWRRLGQHLAWVQTLQVSMYWIRHTILTWVERNFGFAVAEAYAGHEDNGRGARSMGAMATYVRADLPEVATALAALTGEPHPLAIKDPGTGPAGEYRH
jgi:integrase/recombinase XerC